MTRQPQLIDIHVGKLIRRRRWMIGMTQQQLADKVGVTFQQVQKYEIGMNRVSASRIFDIAMALDAPVSFFFDEVGRGTAIEPDRDAVEMMTTFMAIPKDRRHHLLSVAKAMAGDGDGK